MLRVLGAGMKITSAVTMASHVSLLYDAAKFSSAPTPGMLYA